MQNSSKNEISDAQKFRRESEGRTFSERQLDKFILRQQREEQKKEIAQNEDKVLKKMKYDKTAMFSKNTLLKEQQEKEENQDENDILKRQEEKEKQEQQQQQNGVQVHEAIMKIQKHFGNPVKAGKAILMLQKLFEKHGSEGNISISHGQDILYQLMENRDNFKQRPEYMRSVQDIYKHFKKVGVFLKNVESSEKVLDIYFQDFLQLENTDDSFLFNSVLKRFNEYIDKLQEEIIFNKQMQCERVQQMARQKNELEKAEAKKPEKTENAENSVVLSIRDKLNKKKNEQQQQLNSSNSLQENGIQQSKKQCPVYDYQLSKKAQDFFGGENNNNMADQDVLLQIKIELIFNIFKNLVRYYKHDWAKSGINQIISDIYYNKKQLFPIDLQNQMDDVAEKWMDLKNASTAINQKRANLDNKILGGGVSANVVKDARTETISYDNGANT